MQVSLPWTDDERQALLEMGGFEASLARPLPAGAHFRPYPGATGTVVMLWEALHMDVPVAAPPPSEPDLRGALFAELLIRGLSTMVRAPHARVPEWLSGPFMDLPGSPRVSF